MPLMVDLEAFSKSCEGLDREAPLVQYFDGKVSSNELTGVDHGFVLRIALSRDGRVP